MPKAVRPTPMTKAGTRTPSPRISSTKGMAGAGLTGRVAGALAAGASRGASAPVGGLGTGALGDTASRVASAPGDAAGFSNGNNARTKSRQLGKRRSGFFDNA